MGDGYDLFRVYLWKPYFSCNPVKADSLSTEPSFPSVLLGLAASMPVEHGDLGLRWAAAERMASTVTKAIPIQPSNKIVNIFMQT